MTGDPPRGRGADDGTAIPDRLARENYAEAQSLLARYRELSHRHPPALKERALLLAEAQTFAALALADAIYDALFEE